MPFEGKRVLVVEDDAIVAMDLAEILRDARCNVVGPLSSLEEAIVEVGKNSLDAALLDLNLRGYQSFPVMDALVTANIPFVIVTGYERLTLPIQFQYRPIVAKPFSRREVLGALTQAIAR